MNADAPIVARYHQQEASRISNPECKNNTSTLAPTKTTRNFFSKQPPPPPTYPRHSLLKSFNGKATLGLGQVLWISIIFFWLGRKQRLQMLFSMDGRKREELFGSNPPSESATEFLNTPSLAISVSKIFLRGNHPPMKFEAFSGKKIEVGFLFSMEAFESTLTNVGKYMAWGRLMDRMLRIFFK